MEGSKLIRITTCLFLIFATLILGLFVPSSVYAIDYPENGGGNGSIERSGVFQNIFVQGDWLFVSVYNLEYSIEPDESASLCYTYSITTAGGLTIVSNPLRDYYQANIVAIYLSPNDSNGNNNVVDYNFGTEGNPYSTWGTSYNAVVQGNSGKFVGTPPVADDTLSSSYFPGNSFNYPLDDPLADMAYCQKRLDNWLISAMEDIENITGETLITKVRGRNYINNDGAAYVTDAIPGISRITNVFSLKEFVPEVTASYDDFEYQQELLGNITITFCEKEDLAYWQSNCTGFNCKKSTIDNYSIDRLQGDYSVRAQHDDPVPISQHNIWYDPPDDMNLGSRSLVFWWICDRASTDFNQSRVYVYDTDGDYYGWDFSFQNEISSSHSFSLSSPTYSSGTVSLTDIDYVEWSVETLDDTDFTFCIDNVHARGVPGMGVFTEEAFDGLGEWLGVSGTFVGGIFFFFIYLIAASIIYLTTSNHVAALAICIPVILFAILLGVIPMSFMALVIFLLIVAIAYFVWIRGA